MFFSKASKKALDDLEEYKVDMADLKEDLNTFKKNIEADLVSIRKDFKELILFLQDSGGVEDSPPVEEFNKAEQEKNTIDRAMTKLMERRIMFITAPLTYYIFDSIRTVAAFLADGKRYFLDHSNSTYGDTMLMMQNSEKWLN